MNMRITTTPVNFSSGLQQRTLLCLFPFLILGIGINQKIFAGERDRVLFTLHNTVTGTVTDQNGVPLTGRKRNCERNKYRNPNGLRWEIQFRCCIGQNIGF